MIRFNVILTPFWSPHPSLWMDLDIDKWTHTDDQSPCGNWTRNSRYGVQRSRLELDIPPYGPQFSFGSCFVTVWMDSMAVEHNISSSPEKRKRLQLSFFLSFLLPVFLWLRNPLPPFPLLHGSSKKKKLLSSTKSLCSWQSVKVGSPATQEETTEERRKFFFFFFKNTNPKSGTMSCYCCYQRIKKGEGGICGVSQQNDSGKGRVRRYPSAR